MEQPYQVDQILKKTERGQLPKWPKDEQLDISGRQAGQGLFHSGASPGFLPREQVQKLFNLGILHLREPEGSAKIIPDFLETYNFTIEDLRPQQS